MRAHSRAALVGTCVALAAAFLVPAHATTSEPQNGADLSTTAEENIATPTPDWPTRPPGGQPAPAPSPSPAPAPAPGGAGQPPAVTGPHVRGTKTEPTYSYANAIRESVLINTNIDSDRNGQNDKVRFDYIRPREAAEKGVKVPVIIDPSPYYEKMGRGPTGERKKYDSSGLITKMPQFYDNYFVPRGYAVGAVDIMGTAKSTGCMDGGGKIDTLSVVAVVDWLNGRATATNVVGGGEVKATSWSTGSTAYIGKSYDGTVAIGAAATGVQGLRTIVPISAISSWYDYTRYHGIVTKRHYMPQLVGQLTNNSGGCSSVTGALGSGQDDMGAKYNAMWAERDYVKDAAKFTASVWLIHGMEDNNVFPSNAGNLYRALAQHNVPRRMWLAQAKHDDPFDFRRKEFVDELHSWFDHWLQGLANDAMTRPQGQGEHEVGKWRSLAQWPAPNAKIQLGKGALGQAGSGNVAITNGTFQSEDELTAANNAATKQVFQTGTLSQDVRIAGMPSVTLAVKPSQGKFPMTARLVDYGPGRQFTKLERGSTTSTWGEGTDADTATYADYKGGETSTNQKVIGRGWVNSTHHASLSNPQPLPTGQWTEITVPLMATDAQVPAGHKLGLVISMDDGTWVGGDGGGSVEIDLARSFLTLPTTSADAIRP